MSTKLELQGDEAMQDSKAGRPPFKRPASPSKAVEEEALEAGATARTAGFQIGDEGDALHGKATFTLIERAGKVLDRAIADPNSDENEIVRVILMNQMGQIEGAQLREDPRFMFSEERHRGIEYHRQAELAKHQNVRLKAATAKLNLEQDRLKKQIEKLELELKAGEMKLEQTRRVLDQARVSTEVGQPMDPQKVYRRIAEIVGLRAPEQAEPAQEAR